MLTVPSRGSNQGLATIQTRVLLATLIFAITILVLLVVTVWQVARQTDERAWLTNLDILTHSASTRTQAFIERQFYVLNSQFQHGAEFWSEDTGLAVIFLQEHPSYFELVLFDSNGNALSSVATQPLDLSNQANLNQKTWFQDALADGQGISGINYDPEGNPYIVLATRTPEGGVLAGRINALEIQTILQETSNNDAKPLAIIDQTGEIIVTTHPEVFTIMDWLTANTITDMASIADQAAWLQVDSGSEILYIVSSQIDAGDWLLFTAVPSVTIHQASNSLTSGLGVGLFLSLLVLSVSLYLYLYYAIVRPVNNLTITVGRIIGGDYSPDSKLDVPGNSEISRLAATIRHMQSELQTRQTQIHQQNQSLTDEIERRRASELNLRQTQDELEERVRLRTIELVEANRNLQREVNERKRIEQALRVSEERYQLATQGANDGIWDWDLRSNRIYLSPRWKHIIGFDETDLGDSPDEWLKRVHPEDLPALQAQLQAHIRQQTTHFQAEYRIRHHDGSYIWVLTRGLVKIDTDGRPFRMSGSQTDISLRKIAEEKLVYEATHDSLTGLSNRTHMLERLDIAIHGLRVDRDHIFAVLFLDIDRFKIINDSLGHQVGDELLVNLSNRLRNLLRPHDTIGRLGGDEFIILLTALPDQQMAHTIAERILKEVRDPFMLSGHEVFITGSIGIAYGSPNYTAATEIVRDADIALYRAKEAGKARYQVFNLPMRTMAMTRQVFESMLYSAIERNEFLIHYQPIIAMPNNKLLGFEALLRWLPEGQDPIPPSDFIPIAEENGLITRIGTWVIGEACRQLAEWRKIYHVSDDIYVSVNVSSIQLREDDFIEIVSSSLKEHNLTPSSIRLELTESSFAGTETVLIQTLNKLNSIGVRLMIDDFGTGYSSLGYLQTLPVHTIKIDRSFIQSLPEGEKKTDLVRGILSMARDLGLETIAEGIELEEHYTILNQMGCRMGQGYLIGKPAHKNEIGAILSMVRNQNGDITTGGNSGSPLKG